MAAPADSALPPFARRVEGGIELHLRVVPGSSRSEIVGPLGDRLKVRVTAPPEGGRANRAVVRLLRDWLGGDAEIVAGHGSPDKTARVGLPPGQVRGLGFADPREGNSPSKRRRRG